MQSRLPVVTLRYLRLPGDIDRVNDGVDLGPAQHPHQRLGVARIGVARPVHVHAVAEVLGAHRVGDAPLHPLGVERGPPHVASDLPQQRDVEGVGHFAVERLHGLLTVRRVPDPVGERGRAEDGRCGALGSPREPFADAIGDAGVHDGRVAPPVRLGDLRCDGDHEWVGVRVDVGPREAARLVDAQPRLGLQQRDLDGALPDGGPLLGPVAPALWLRHRLRLVGEQPVDDARPLLGREGAAALGLGLGYVLGQLEVPCRAAGCGR